MYVHYTLSIYTLTKRQIPNIMLPFCVFLFFRLLASLRVVRSMRKERKLNFSSSSQRATGKKEEREGKNSKQDVLVVFGPFPPSPVSSLRRARVPESEDGFWTVDRRRRSKKKYSAGKEKKKEEDKTFPPSFVKMMPSLSPLLFQFPSFQCENIAS